MIFRISLADVPRLLSFFRKLVRVDANRVERPEDADAITLQQEKEWVQTALQKQAAGDMFIRIAVANDEVVAEVELERKPRWIERHVGELRFGVIPGHEALAKEAIEEVLGDGKAAGVETVVYFHLRTQESGIGLMRQLGFKDAGVIEQYYRRDGNVIDRVYLTKIL